MIYSKPIVRIFLQIKKFERPEMNLKYQFIAVSVQIVVGIICLSLYFDNSYHQSIIDHVNLKLTGKEKLPQNALHKLQKEFSPMLLRIPIITVITGVGGLITISHIGRFDKIFVRF